jgi:hypothetical protein
MKVNVIISLIGFYSCTTLAYIKYDENNMSMCVLWGLGALINVIAYNIEHENKRK